MGLIRVTELSIPKAFAAFSKNGQFFSSCYLTSIQRLSLIIVTDTLTIAQSVFTLKLKLL